MNKPDEICLRGISILMRRRATISTWFNQTLTRAIKRMRIKRLKGVRFWLRDERSLHEEVTSEQRLQ